MASLCNHASVKKEVGKLSVNRIKQRFEVLKQQGRKALIPYVVLGDPAADVTLPVMHALVEQGADILELGVPFQIRLLRGR